MFGMWVGEEEDKAVSDLIPGRLTRKIEARRSPSKRGLKIEQPSFASPPGEALITRMPEDLAKNLFHPGEWVYPQDLLRLRVCRSLSDAVGTKPFLLLRYLLPVLQSWRALAASRRPALPTTPRSRRPRQNSFQRSPHRRRHNAERALLLF